MASGDTTPRPCARLRRVIAAGCLVALCAASLASPAAAQWEPPDRRTGLQPRFGRDRQPAPTRGAESSPDPSARWVDFSFSAGSWWWLSHFRAETSNDRFEITGPTTGDVRLAVTWPVWKQLELDFAPEFAMGSKTQTWVVGIGAALRIEWFDAWWFMRRGQLRTRLGLLTGGFDWDKSPGSFDPGFGAELGVEFAFGADWLWDALAVTVGCDLRSLTFDFDPDPNVVDTDSAYGGFGVVLRFGVRYAI